MGIRRQTHVRGFEAGGKQHRVEVDEVIRVEKIEAEVGSSVDFDKVLMVADGDSIEIGAPLVAGGVVKAEIVGQVRGDKVKIIKFKRRKHHMKRMGHRQWYTEVKITSIANKARPHGTQKSRRCTATVAIQNQTPRREAFRRPNPSR